MAMAREESLEEGEVRWAGHYSSMHDILLVGEGDFSFSLSLATTFGSASNIVSTSLDTYDALISKYSNAKENLRKLSNMGAKLLHGIDATKMKIYADLNRRKFDRIIFNFPHAGFKGREHNLHLVAMHRRLVSGFFHNASHMLWRDGEIHVSHKTSAPFCWWNLEKLAARDSLVLIKKVNFRSLDYPGYNNKRGDGNRCDLPFPLGECSTFKFGVSKDRIKKKSANCKLCNSKLGDGGILGRTHRNLQRSYGDNNARFNSWEEEMGRRRDHVCYGSYHRVSNLAGKEATTAYWTSVSSASSA